ncbi:MAG TPA: hypothetical protein VFA04_26065 [Bryobacteraceae bacterium]|nr:hypothetical protein [Bryobacteraceae bacterium]
MRSLSELLSASSAREHHRVRTTYRDLRQTDTGRPEVSVAAKIVQHPDVSGVTRQAYLLR